MRKVSDRIIPSLSLLLIGFCVGCFNPFGGAPTHNSYLNQVPPELPTDSPWINSLEPLTLDALRGQVVWLEFSFLS